MANLLYATSPPQHIVYSANIQPLIEAVLKLKRMLRSATTFASSKILRYSPTNASLARSSVRFVSNSFEVSSFKVVNYSIDQTHRISLLTELPNVPGALYGILGYFWKYDVNLNHIESRPTSR
jgi:hypothetical protein